MSYDNSNDWSEYLRAEGFTGIQYPLSIVMWIKRTAAQWDDASFEYICCLKNDTAYENDDRAALATYNTANTVATYNYDSAGTNTNISYSFADTTYDDVWVPIIGVWDAASTGLTNEDRYIYIENSSNVASETTPDSTIASAFANFRVAGVYGSNDAQTYPGKYAEIAIFTKALSTAEIDAIQTATGTGPPPNTIAPDDCFAYWPLNTDQATHTDQSGNGGPSLVEAGATGPTYDSDHPTIIGIDSVSGDDIVNATENPWTISGTGFGAD